MYPYVRAEALWSWRVTVGELIARTVTVRGHPAVPDPLATYGGALCVWCIKAVVYWRRHLHRSLSSEEFLWLSFEIHSLIKY